jgi:hypothetical protein
MLQAAVAEAVAMSDWAHTMLQTYMNGDLSQPARMVMFQTIETYFGSPNIEKMLESANSLLRG